MPKFYPETPSNPNFPQIEENILKFWEEQKSFQKSIDNRDGKEEFIFYDGPPFANGLPHFGHILTSFVKDIFARYQTMNGKKVERRFGWDCHGLPAEMGAEKELGISGRIQIMDYGIDKFNAHCKTSVMKYTHEWESYVNRQARWVDFKNDYKTMDKSFMESVIWAFKELYKKGYIYESLRVMPYSWACETPLSNFETRLDNSYRERTDKAVTVAFTLKEKPTNAPSGCKSYKILAWTTTPWTLPSNLALAVGGEMEYSSIIKDETCYIIAKSSVSHYLKELGLEKSAPERIIETSRLYLRPYTKDDLELLYSLHSSEEVGNTTIDGPQVIEQTKKDLEEFILHQKEHGYSQWAVFEKGTDKYVGRAGLTLRSADVSSPPQMEVRYALFKEFWGKGYASEIAVACVYWGFRHYDVDQIVASAGPANYPSHRVLEKAGLRFVKNIIYREQECVYYSAEREDIMIKGSDLAGLTYAPLFPYFKDHPNSFRILIGDFVTEGDGTGIVHMAPGFGEDDQVLCQQNGISVVCPVDNAGKFTAEVPDFAGLQVFEANDEIIKYLKADGGWIKTEQYIHNYPHCWRTDTPLIYKAVSSWYVAVSKFKDRMVELNQQINWIPGHIKDGLFGKWLENARDWSISRNRFWGCPVPIWRSDNPDNKELYVFGSMAELQEFFGVEVTDLHRPFIDNLTKVDPIDSKYTIRRVEDVLDCWFESGSMPYAQVHYPFENKEWFEEHFPADFIVEYTAQTRGWFYTLMVLGTALFDKPPFLNCICHGVILDEKGQKLSKRLNNYTDPKILFANYGADPLRWLMASSPVMRGQELLIDKDAKMVKDVLRLVVKPIWNSYNFFTLYANADGIKASYINDFTKISNLMDQYILKKLVAMVAIVKKSMDEYDTYLACKSVEEFVEVLNNWYIRRSRPRFWAEEKTLDKQQAYDTLYTILHVLSRAISPLLPLITEEIYQGLTGEESVHLADFPALSEKGLENIATDVMDKARDICNAALGIRNNEKIRVRQPLASLTIAGANIMKLQEHPEIIEVIKDEINVKQVIIKQEVEEFANFKLQLNFSVLGKRLPDKVKQIIPLAKQNQWKMEANKLIIAGEELREDEYNLLLEPKDGKSSAPLAANDAIVALDLFITNELEKEGIARDIIRFVQQSRKDAGLNISDKIMLSIVSNDNMVAEAISKYREMIESPTLASITQDELQHNFEADLEGRVVKISFGVR